MDERLKKFLVTQKFRFDMAVTFMSVVTLSLMAITASDKIQFFLNDVVGLNLKTYEVILFVISLALLSTWFFGFFLDRKMKYWQGLLTVQNERNPQITEILNNTREIKKKLDVGGK